MVKIKKLIALLTIVAFSFFAIADVPIEGYYIGNGQYVRPNIENAPINNTQNDLNNKK